MIHRHGATLIAALCAIVAAPALAGAPSISPIPELRASGTEGAVQPIRTILTTMMPPQIEGPVVEQVILMAAAPASRPLPRPELPVGRHPDAIEAVAARGIFSPATAALIRPRSRPEAHGLATPAIASAPSAAIAVSPLVISRSPVPSKRTETARLRHLQRVSAAVRASPPSGAITGRDSGSLCGISGIQGSTIPPISSNVNACGIDNPVRVTAVDGVALSQAAVLHCDTARALHGWVREGLRPALAKIGGQPEQLRVAAHYVCRTRNHRPGAAVSEHGKGRAIDISAIRLASGEVISVLHGWRDAYHAPVLRAMHRAACGTFTTTLGPGSDGYHEDHFHYDTAQRRNAYCR